MKRLTTILCLILSLGLLTPSVRAKLTIYNAATNQPIPSLQETAEVPTKLTVTVDGTPIVFTDAEPFVDENNRTMLPVSALADALQCEISWNDQEKACTVTCSNQYEGDYTCPQYGTKSHTVYSEFYTAVCSIGSTTLCTTSAYNRTTHYLNVSLDDYTHDSQFKHDYIMDTTPVIRNDRIYLPAAYIANFAGYFVAWDGSTNTVALTSGRSMGLLKLPEI